VSESIIVVSIVVLLRHIVKTGILGPSVIFSVISLGQMLVFYLAVELTLYPEIMAGWWQVSTEYKTSTVEVLIVYLYLIFVSYCSSVSIDKAKSEDENLKKVLYLHFLESKVFFLIIFALFMLCVLHLILIDLDKIISYKVYLSIRNFEFVGVDSTIFSTLHKLLPLIGLFLAPVFVYHVYKKNWLLLFFSFSVFSYSFLYSLSLASRFSVLQILVVAVTIYLLDSRRKLLVFFISLLALTVFAGVLSIRFVNITYQLGFGIPSLLLIYEKHYKVFLDASAFLFFNVFGGGFGTAVNLSEKGVEYPFLYKILSFSPFPSFLDGFSQVRDAEVRINEYAPFNNLSEVYHFGLFYVVVYTLFLSFFLRAYDRFYKAREGVVYFIIMLPAFFGFFVFHNYPIRNSFRWMVVSFLVVVAINTFGQKARVK